MIKLMCQVARVPTCTACPASLTSSSRAVSTSRKLQRLFSAASASARDASDCAGVAIVGAQLMIRRARRTMPTGSQAFRLQTACNSSKSCLRVQEAGLRECMKAHSKMPTPP